MIKNNYVITIGRQFGSGGRELGRLLAEKLGIAYYDKELLGEAAKHSGLNAEIFERNDERSPSFLSGMFSVSSGYNPIVCYASSSSITADNIYRVQSDFIRQLANTQSCVIVGRSADHILRDHPNAINLFIHATMDDCIARIMRRGDKTTPEQAKVIAEKTNKLRASYYNFYTDKKWGDAASYDLTFNSSRISIEEIASIVIDYIYKKFGEPHSISMR